MAKKWLLKVTPTEIITRDTWKENVLVSREIVQYVTPFEGYGYALESITSGEKVFGVWELRRRLKTLVHPVDPLKCASYVVLTDEEKEMLLRGVKTIDWTFRQQVTFWVKWEAFFKDLESMVEFDERNPPVEYLEAKKAFEDGIAEYEAAIKAAEEKLLAELKDATNAILEVKLKELQDAGKFGSAATIDDLPDDVKKAATEKAKADIEAKKRGDAAAATPSQEQPVPPPMAPDAPPAPESVELQNPNAGSNAPAEGEFTEVK